MKKALLAATLLAASLLISCGGDPGAEAVPEKEDPRVDPVKATEAFMSAAVELNALVWQRQTAPDNETDLMVQAARAIIRSSKLDNGRRAFKGLPP